LYYHTHRYILTSLLFLDLFDADAHRLTLDRRQGRNGLQSLADTELTRLVRHHHHRHRRALDLSTAFLQHRFDADRMLAEYPCNARQTPRLVDDLKAQIVLAGHILDALVRHILQAVVLIRLWGHAAAAVFQDITRHIDDIPHYGTASGKGPGTAANQHIAA